jgi:hypothetical protein
MPDKSWYFKLRIQYSLSYYVIPINGNPSCQARLQMHWDSKILLNCYPSPRLERTFLLYLFISLQKDDFKREGLVDQETVGQSIPVELHI